MLHPTADLREVVEAVVIHAADRFTVSGESFELPPGDGGVSAMAQPLANTLYQRLYCRPERHRPGPPRDRRVARVFVDALSGANCGSGTWEPGWAVEEVEDDGTLVVHKERDDLTLWAQPEQFRPIQGEVGLGSMGRLRLGKELREMLPGYYTALGDADQRADDAESPVEIVRFYWHLTAEMAPTWIRELTRRSNAAGVAFHAKVLSDPGTYFRADAGVLYVARVDLPTMRSLLPGLHAAVASHLRPSIPMFTKRLARGLAVAEDPGDGRSFGQHRCQLVAEGLVRAFESGKTAFGDVTDAIAARFADEGLVITRPWLNAGSRQLDAWPTGHWAPRDRA